MRLTVLLIASSCLLGCGDSGNTSDAGMTADLSMAGMDMSASTDMKSVTPFNMPGKVDCYGMTCSTTSANPICCDAATDGGFNDSCVASAAACLATDSSAKTFQCGQAADCGSGMVCCGNIGMSSSGKPFFVSTMCAASCPSGNTQLCVTGSECKTSGAQCVGQAISGRDVGLCK